MKNILIIDDAVSQKMLSRIFKPFTDQIRIFTAGNTFETQSITINQQLDMVFMDLQIPDIDGFDFLADIIVSCPDIPVFVMTAFGTYESRAHVEKIANCRYIEKPLDIGILKDWVLKELKIDDVDQHAKEKASVLDQHAILTYDEQMRIPDLTSIENRLKNMTHSVKCASEIKGNEKSSDTNAAQKKTDNKNIYGNQISPDKFTTTRMLSNSLIKTRGVSAYRIFDKEDALQTCYPEYGDIKIKPLKFREMLMDVSDILNPEGLHYMVFKTNNHTRHVIFEFRDVCAVMTVSPDFYLKEFMHKIRKIDSV